VREKRLLKQAKRIVGHEVENTGNYLKPYAQLETWRPIQRGEPFLAMPAWSEYRPSSQRI